MPMCRVPAKLLTMLGLTATMLGRTAAAAEDRKSMRADMIEMERKEDRYEKIWVGSWFEVVWRGMSIGLLEEVVCSGGKGPIEAICFLMAQE